MWPLFLDFRPINWKISVKSINYSVWSPKTKAMRTFMKVVIWQKKVYLVCSRVKVSKLSKKGWAYFLKCCHDKLNLHESSFFVDLTHHLLVSSFLFFFAGKRDKIASCWFSPAATTEQHKREVNRRAGT